MRVRNIAGAEGQKSRLMLLQVRIVIDQDIADHFVQIEQAGSVAERHIKDLIIGLLIGGQCCQHIGLNDILNVAKVTRDRTVAVDFEFLIAD